MSLGSHMETVYLSLDYLRTGRICRQPCGIASGGAESSSIHGGWGCSGRQRRWCSGPTARTPTAFTEPSGFPEGCSADRAEPGSCRHSRSATTASRRGLHCRPRFTRLVLTAYARCPDSGPDYSAKLEVPAFGRSSRGAPLRMLLRHPYPTVCTCRNDGSNDRVAQTLRCAAPSQGWRAGTISAQ